MLYSTSLLELVPKDNFYRRLDQCLDLHFLYPATAPYYGTEGQESIDPVVFFKILLVGYLNNITSDRRLLEYCADSLGVRLFLRYDIDEALPWHSTISRTRQLYGEEVFKGLFDKVLSMCVSQGMVRGKRQAIDSAFVKANASMDSLFEKEILSDAREYVQELNEQSEYPVKTPALAVPNPNTDENGNLIRGNKLSNQTHSSSTDPDARISTKPGKARQLNYYAQVAVDDAHHVITGAMADFADARDSDCLPSILSQTKDNLANNGIEMEQVLADTNYSSGAALRFCEENHIDAYIPNIGTYHPAHNGFKYNEKLDQYECQNGSKAILSYRGIKTDKGYDRHIYRSSQKVCKDCPLRETCCGKSTKYKMISDSVDKELYDRMHQKLKKGPIGKRMSRIRSKTVEPVLGTLINYGNMKRVNARGIFSANKHVIMASLSYNLRKLMKFMSRPFRKAATALVQPMGNAFFPKSTFCPAITALL